LSEAQHIAATLRRMRRIRGLTQADLAERAGVSTPTVSELEMAKRPARPSTLRKFADALGVEVETFFPAEDHPKAQGPRLSDLLEMDGKGWHEALRDITPEQRDRLVREISAEHARMWAEFQATDNAGLRAELERRGRRLMSLEAITRYGPSAIPVRLREFA
jgi:transcriptional regulator with XRE-family HTH domain